MRIGAVISYSSYHNPFISRVISEAKKVADCVFVASHTHFYDGQLDTELISSFEGTARLLWPFIPGKQARDYHNELRLHGYDALRSTGEYDFVFFIDSDEVLDGDKVKLWLTESVESECDYKLAHFWYYRDTCFRADTVEEGAVLVSKQTLERPDFNWYGERERENFSQKWNYMASYKNKVLGHHYSWAGTKEMLTRKVKSWGHSGDGVAWAEMVEQEFAKSFQYKCPFKPYNFTKVEPFIGFTFEKNT